jgi:hypothetical protein
MSETPKRPPAICNCIACSLNRTISVGEAFAKAACTLLEESSDETAGQPAIESIILQGDSVTVLMRASGVLKSTGQAYSLSSAQCFTFANEQIGRIDQIAAFGKPD